VQLDPDRPARGLSIADQQLVEIAKALSFDARILVMDEPTAALSGVEVDRLFAVVRALRDGGAAVLFISTGWTRSSRCASGSRSCATAGG
jgi:rhamnose transport system ATP-binding protein